MSLYVQYGCGQCAPQGWVNFDASPTLLVEKLIPWRRGIFPDAVRFGNIVRGLPITPDSCDGIYASHVLEHLSREHCARALANTARYLKPSGIFRLVVPDLTELAREYIAHGDAHRFMRNSGLGRERRSFLRDAIGNSAHLWLWDEASMTAALRDAGFTGIRRASFNDSAEPRFREVEDAGRFAGCLALECQGKNSAR